MGGRAAPVQPKKRVETATLDIDECDDATIRVAAGDDGENGKQQDVRKGVELALRPARVGNPQRLWLFELTSRN